jgi:hypothetical protein
MIHARRPGRWSVPQKGAAVRELEANVVVLGGGVGGFAAAIATCK